MLLSSFECKETEDQKEQLLSQMIQLISSEARTYLQGSSFHYVLTTMVYCMVNQSKNAREHGIYSVNGNLYMAAPRDLVNSFDASLLLFSRTVVHICFFSNIQA